MVDVRSASASTWPSPTESAKKLSPRFALVAYFGSWLSVISAVALISRAGVELPQVSGALGIDTAWLMVVVQLNRTRAISPIDLGLRPVPGIRAAGLAVLVLLLCSGFDELWLNLVRPGDVTRPLHLTADDGTLVIVLSGVAVVISPVVEEIFFRGLIYRALRNRISTPPAAAIVGVLFAAIHLQYPLGALPELTIYGAALCLLYERTGSLVPGILLDLYLDLGGFERAISGSILITSCSFLAILGVLIARSVTKSIIGRY
jgi:membrane protease YdiL (CAAX protease family)